jgi:hypothetical protein
VNAVCVDQQSGDVTPIVCALSHHCTALPPYLCSLSHSLREVGPAVYIHARIVRVCGPAAPSLQLFSFAHLMWFVWIVGILFFCSVAASLDRLARLALTRWG